MTDVTNPGSDAPEVANAPAAEQDFTAFEESLGKPETVAEAVDEDSEVEADFADTQEGEEAPEAPADDDDDLIEIDHKGRKYKVPKGAALMQADYTKKTQEVAELRKRFEMLTTQAEEASAEEQQHQIAYLDVSRQLAQYENIDWATWCQQNPVAAMQAQLDYQALQQRKQEIGQAYGRAREQRLTLAQQEAAKRLSEGQRVLAEKIPNWGETKQREIINHALTAYGFDADDLAAIDDPRVVLVLHDALQFAAMTKKQQAAVKAAKVQAVKPVTTLKGNNNRTAPRADTNDFLAFERLANAKLARR